MKTRTLAVAAAVLAAALTVATAASSARAHEREREDHHEEGSGRRSHDGGGLLAADPVYLKECGACHLAYPPRLLPASSWRALLAGLDRHFGQDATLEPEVRAALERWLVANAGREPRTDGAPGLRVTGSRWFADEHDDLPAGAAARPSIRSLANCGACHPGAERWDFDEDRVKIPRG
jgi:hypothetical protein